MGQCHNCVALISGAYVFAGIPVVDGVSITQSFSASLQTPVVDAPLIISSMGQECDAGPDVDVHAMPETQWLQLLNATFNQQPWQYGSEVAAAYAADTAVDPALAYAAINADYSLTCGNVAIASAAKLSNFKSPIYVILNQWHPEHTAAQRRPRWAYHSFDYAAAFEQWDDQKMVPSEQDLQFSRLMQDVFAAFIYGNFSVHNPWNIRTIDSDPKFPTSAVTNVVSIESGGSIPVVNYKYEQCQMWARIGLDDRFWWIN